MTGSEAVGCSQPGTPETVAEGSEEQRRGFSGDASHSQQDAGNEPGFRRRHHDREDGLALLAPRAMAPSRRDTARRAESPRCCAGRWESSSRPGRARRRASKNALAAARPACRRKFRSRWRARRSEDRRCSGPRRRTPTAEFRQVNAAEKSDRHADAGREAAAWRCRRWHWPCRRQLRRPGAGSLVKKFQVRLVPP